MKDIGYTLLKDTNDIELVLPEEKQSTLKTVGAKEVIQEQGDTLVEADSIDGSHKGLSKVEENIYRRTRRYLGASNLTFIFEAINERDTENLRIYLEALEIEFGSVDKEDLSGRKRGTPLFYACEKRYVECVEIILKFNANPFFIINGTLRTDNSPLKLATVKFTKNHSTGDSSIYAVILNLLLSKILEKKSSFIEYDIENNFTLKIKDVLSYGHQSLLMKIVQIVPLSQEQLSGLIRQRRWDILETVISHPYPNLINDIYKIAYCSLTLGDYVRRLNSSKNRVYRVLSWIVKKSKLDLKYCPIFVVGVPNEHLPLGLCLYVLSLQAGKPDEEIIEELLRLYEEKVCYFSDLDFYNTVHWIDYCNLYQNTTVQNILEQLEALLSLQPKREKTYLHLSAEYYTNSKVFLYYLTNQDEEFLFQQDTDGNTFLHILFLQHRHFGNKMRDILVKTLKNYPLLLNLKNHAGETALDKPFKNCLKDMYSYEFESLITCIKIALDSGCFDMESITMVENVVYSLVCSFSRDMFHIANLFDEVLSGIFRTFRSCRDSFLVSDTPFVDYMIRNFGGYSDLQALLLLIKPEYNQYRAPLHESFTRKNIVLFRHVASFFPIDEVYQGQHILHTVVRYDFCDLYFDELIKNNVDVNVRDKDGYSAIWVAVSRDNKEYATKLVKKFIDRYEAHQVNVGDDEPTPVIFLAARKKMDNVVKIMINQDLSLLSVQYQGKTLLDYYAEDDNPKMCAWILSRPTYRHDWNTFDPTCSVEYSDSIREVFNKHKMSEAMSTAYEVIQTLNTSRGLESVATNEVICQQIARLVESIQILTMRMESLEIRTNHIATQMSSREQTTFSSGNYTYVQNTEGNRARHDP